MITMRRCTLDPLPACPDKAALGQHMPLALASNGPKEERVATAPHDTPLAHIWNPKRGDRHTLSRPFFFPSLGLKHDRPCGAKGLPAGLKQ